MLRDSFTSADQQRRALEVASRAWFEPAELDLYDLSQRAFDPSSSEDEAFRSFKQIYNSLASPGPPSYWNVFRPRSRAECWPPQQIFDTIKREFAEFSRDGAINLVNYFKSGTDPRLKASLMRMRGIKPNKDYPHMTVSKFLHFYNPSLFPIYDEKMIWNNVITPFEAEFRNFRGNEYYWRDETFLLYYWGWASSLLSGAHEGFMQVFGDWLNKQPGSNLSQRRFDYTRLYARAFEFTALGASEIRDQSTSAR
jgi:hypothetical protein